MKVFNVFILVFVITTLFVLVNHIEENFYAGVTTYTNTQSYRKQANAQTSSPTGMIVGIVLGVVFLLVCIGYLLYRKYKPTNV
jgi:hypothetical protein